MKKKILLKKSQFEIINEFEEAQQVWGWQAAEGRNKKATIEMKRRANKSRRALEEMISKLNRRIRKLKEET